MLIKVLTIVGLVIGARWSDAHVYLKKKPLKLKPRQSFPTVFVDMKRGEGRPTEWFISVYQMFNPEFGREIEFIEEFFRTSAPISDLITRMDLSELPLWIGQTFLDASRSGSLLGLWIKHIWDPLPTSIKKQALKTFESTKDEFALLFAKYHSIWNFKTLGEDEIIKLVEGNFEELVEAIDTFLACGLDKEVKNVFRLDTEKVLLLSIEKGLEAVFRLYCQGTKPSKAVMMKLGMEPFPDIRVLLPFYIYKTRTTMKNKGTTRTPQLAIEMSHLMKEPRVPIFRSLYEPIREVEITLPAILLFVSSLYVICSIGTVLKSTTMAGSLS